MIVSEQYHYEPRDNLRAEERSEEDEKKEFPCILLAVPDSSFAFFCAII